MMAIDFLATPFFLWLAYVMRLSDVWPERYLYHHWWIFLFSAFAAIGIFTYNHFYRSVMRYVGSDILFQIVKSVFLLSLSIMVLGFFAAEPIMPRSVPFIFALLVTFYAAASRYSIRYYYHWVISHLLNKQHVAIYGAGGAGVQLALALENSMELKPVAFVDDDKSLYHTSVHGLRVYARRELKDLVGSLEIKHVLLAMPSVSDEKKNELIRELTKDGIKVMTVPSMPEIVMGAASIDTLRKVEIEDLLNRDTVVPEEALIAKSLVDKVVLVTGAGGSIGSEICRQVVHNGAKKLVMLDACEFNLYRIDQELGDSRPVLDGQCEIVPILGSICDAEHLDRILTDCPVQTVYHAAAYKHVPLVESNILAAVKNNILGTKTLCECVLRHGAERFILISTDKAVRPANIMGISKRVSELIVKDMADRSEKTIFTMVRFGNVLGSSGSVVPLFSEQIRNGGPVTVTHPDVTRYFMTIPEAALLVIQAGSLSKGGEVFVLDMGREVKISDLAQRMIELSGHTVKSEDNPTGDIEIKYIGLRAGEKMTEELAYDNNLSGTAHPHILVAMDPLPVREHLQELLRSLKTALEQCDEETAGKILRKPMIAEVSAIPVYKEVGEKPDQSDQQAGEDVAENGATKA
ncbi:nucleoside-diphosphate sugar epimerase/dehydratase [uncultured Cohaesibacter sp.]|uniref:polysaccharide biosynthesis protein n=1 Tax=uncultured Cohaesibacter sp. TaxID=1002546 RepID=UPI00293145A8|nr:nucleoside-diphosphate sugar epimerase/dehydratase [uncultured Cohaesibacter sp.]